MSHSGPSRTLHAGFLQVDSCSTYTPPLLLGASDAPVRTGRPCSASLATGELNCTLCRAESGKVLAYICSASARLLIFANGDSECDGDDEFCSCMFPNFHLLLRDAQVVRAAHCDHMYRSFLQRVVISFGMCVECQAMATIDAAQVRDSNEELHFVTIVHCRGRAPTIIPLSR